MGGIEMARAAKDVFGVEGSNVEGNANGHVRFSGNTGDVASIQGEGYGVIRNAQLAELPLFLGLLRILKLDFGSPQQRDFFHEVRLPYRIEKQAFRVNEMAIRSKALTLIGSGTLDFQGGLDLVLRPQVIDAPVPIWDQLTRLVKDAFMRVRVKGDLVKPTVKLVTGLGLIDVPLDRNGKKGLLRRWLPSFNFGD